MQRRVSLLLRIFIPVAIFGWLFYRLDFGLVFQRLSTLDPFIFLSAFVLLCLRNALGAWRSMLLLDSKALNHPFLTLLKHYFIGNFFTLFMPEVIGRDISRGIYLYKSSNSRKSAVGSIFVERLFGTIALVSLSLMSIFAAYLIGYRFPGDEIIKAILILTIISGIIVLIFFNRSTDRIIERFSPDTASRLHGFVSFTREIVSFSRATSAMGLTFLISFVFQIVGVVSAYLMALSIGNSVDFIWFLIILPVIWAISMIPVTVNGLGIREGAFVFFFSSAGMLPENAMAISLLWLMQNIGLGVIGGILLLIGSLKNSRVGANKY